MSSAMINTPMSVPSEPHGAALAQPRNLVSDAVLEIRDLSVAYGKVEALSNASLSVGKGQIVTVIGPNGAGKTTLLSAIMGVLGSRGQVHFDGSLEGLPEVEVMVARGLGLVPEKRELFTSMSVADNLLLGAFQRHRRGDRDYAATLKEVYDLFPGCGSAASNWRRLFQVANGRCSPWAGR